MPSKSSYNHYRLSQAKRQTLNINRFGGVDLSSQKFNVASGRAIDAQNFYYKDGVLQVRQGYEELYTMLPYTYVKENFNGGYANTTSVNPVNFNGIWSFVAEDNERHIVAHIGKLLFEIKNFGTKDITFVALTNNGKVNNQPFKVAVGNVLAEPLYEYENFKSSAFVGAKKLWFLGGNKYMLIRFTGNQSETISPVEENDLTFIPTTTMGITYTNAKTSGRALLDYPNMLTMFRKNALVSGVGKSEEIITDTEHFEYQLDGRLWLPNMGNQLTQEQQRLISKIEVNIEHRGKI